MGSVLIDQIEAIRPFSNDISSPNLPNQTKEGYVPGRE
jgi:hypothetical protein